MGPAWSVDTQNVIGTFASYLDGFFGIDSNLLDTWSQGTVTVPAGDSPPQVAVAGSLTYMNLDQTSNAYVSSHALINQNPHYRTGVQDVLVVATGTNSSINLGGQVAVPGIGSSSKQFSIAINQPGYGLQGGAGAFGAAFVVVDYTDNVTATIASGGRSMRTASTSNPRTPSATSR